MQGELCADFAIRFQGRLVMTYACAPASAAAVANEFIEIASHERDVPAVDQMKLQKLLFYAYAWYLAQTGRTLFEENFEAWPWGPVVRNIYYQTADCGRKPINKWMTKLINEDSSPLDARFESPRLEDQDLKRYIRSVWESHKALSGIQLSNATHLQGEPWTIVKDRYGSLDHKPTIPNDLIEAVFKAKMVIARNGTNSSSAATV